MKARHEQYMPVSIDNALETGFLNAATSLAQLVKCTAQFQQFKSAESNTDQIVLAAPVQTYNSVPKYLLTTEIFGELTGKCYLLLSDRDYEFLTRCIPGGSSTQDGFRHEFIKELDNILSAAVISHLANALSLRMYGNVPMLVGRTEAKLEDMISDDFCEQASSIRIYAGCFLCDGIGDISPLFVWVFDSADLYGRV